MQVRIPRLVPIGGVVQRQAHLSVKQETRVRPPSSPPNHDTQREAWKGGRVA